MSPLQYSDSTGSVIYVNTFSKILSPSFRISYMVLPKKIIESFTKKIGIYSCPVPALDQLILADFIDGGHLEKHISRMRNIYRNLRNALIQAIEKSSLSKNSKILEENSGLHFLLEIETEKTKSEIREELFERKIKIAQLDDFYLDGKNVQEKNGRTVLVVNYSALKKDEIPYLVSALESIAKQAA